MHIIYTNHVRFSMKERNIEKVWVEEAIQSPDLIEKEFEKYYARKKLNGKIIEVVYEKKTYIKHI